jgi:mRNA interferase RelE/StbE
MSYIVKLKDSAEKELDRIPQKNHDRIVKSLLSLSSHPLPINTQKLRGRDGYRIRVGNYRILYTVDHQESAIEILAIGHRKDVYRF